MFDFRIQALHRTMTGGCSSRAALRQLRVDAFRPVPAAVDGSPAQRHRRFVVCVAVFVVTRRRDARSPAMSIRSVGRGEMICVNSRTGFGFDNTQPFLFSLLCGFALCFLSQNNHIRQVLRLSLLRDQGRFSFTTYLPDLVAYTLMKLTKTPSHCSYYVLCFS